MHINLGRTTAEQTEHQNTEWWVRLSSCPTGPTHFTSLLLLDLLSDWLFYFSRIMTWTVLLFRALLNKKIHFTNKNLLLLELRTLQRLSTNQWVVVAITKPNGLRVLVQLMRCIYKYIIHVLTIAVSPLEANKGFRDVAKNDGKKHAVLCLKSCAYLQLLPTFFIFSLLVMWYLMHERISVYMLQSVIKWYPCLSISRTEALTINYIWTCVLRH